MVLAEAGKLCSRKITVYLVGGGAMAIRGEKDATKDVDLILEFKEDAEELGNALKGLGFEVNIQPPAECKGLVDAKIMTALIGMHIDIFIQTVCHKLILSQGMKARSDFFGDLNRITLNVCSR
jgi:predicted nucleotidyltransferase